jgi:predicted SprT family Zn-dependent metalloprotease
MVSNFGSVILDEIQGRRFTIMRQCEDCGQFSYKCPECKRLALSPRRPPAIGNVKTTCPNCNQKLVVAEFGYV